MNQLLKNSLIILGTLIIAIPFFVWALPSARYEQNILPFLTTTYDLGTTTNRWFHFFGHLASSSSESFVGNIYIGGTASTTGTATTTIVGANATSTFSGGIRLAQGCFEMANGTCAGTGGGSGTPGGSDTQVQFNDAGSFQGDSAFTWLQTPNILTISGGLISTLSTSTSATSTDFWVSRNTRLASSTIGGQLTVGTINSTTTSASSTFAGGVSANGLFTDRGLTVSSNGATNAVIRLDGGSGGQTVHYITNDGNRLVIQTSNNTSGNGVVFRDAGANDILEIDPSSHSFTISNQTASSSFGGSVAGLDTGGLSSTNGLTLTGGSILDTSAATSTFTGGIQTNLLRVTSGTASSTFAGGIVVGGGVKVSTYNCGTGYTNGGKLTTDTNGYLTCANDSGGTGLTTLNGLTADPQTFTAVLAPLENGRYTTLTISSAGSNHNFISEASSSPNFGFFRATSTAPSYSLGPFGVGTTTPGALFGVHGDLLVGNIVGTSTLKISSSTIGTFTTGVFNATSTATFQNGLTVNAGTVALPAGEIGNAELANSSLTVTAGSGLTGGGAISLGGSATVDVAVDSTLTVSADSLGIALSNPNTWTGQQTINNLVSTLSTSTAATSTDFWVSRNTRLASSTIGGQLTIGTLNSTTTGATSTFAGGLNTNGLFTDNGLTITGGSILDTSSATSTFTGGIATNLLRVTSATASSTFSGGIVVAGGARLSTYNCSTGYANGGKLTTNGNGDLVCADDTSGAGSGYATVQNEGSGLTQRATLNFIGAGVDCVDNAGTSVTDCTIAGATGGGWTDNGSQVVLSTITDYVGVSSSTPFGIFSIEIGSSSPALWIGDQGTSTPALVVNSSGNVGIGTSSVIMGSIYDKLYVDGRINSSWRSMICDFMGTGKSFTVANSDRENIGCGFWLLDTTDTTFGIQILAGGRKGIQLYQTATTGSGSGVSLRTGINPQFNSSETPVFEVTATVDATSFGGGRFFLLGFTNHATNQVNLSPSDGVFFVTTDGRTWSAVNRSSSASSSANSITTHTLGTEAKFRIEIDTAKTIFYVNDKHVATLTTNVSTANIQPMIMVGATAPSVPTSNSMTIMSTRLWSKQ